MDSWRVTFAWRGTRDARDSMLQGACRVQGAESDLGPNGSFDPGSAPRAPGVGRRESCAGCRTFEGVVGGVLHGRARLRCRRAHFDSAGARGQNVGSSEGCRRLARLRSDAASFPFNSDRLRRSFRWKECWTGSYWVPIFRLVARVAVCKMLDHLNRSALKEKLRVSTIPFRAKASCLKDARLWIGRRPCDIGSRPAIRPHSLLSTTLGVAFFLSFPFSAARQHTRSR
jgi:hypothetical protein